jgi:hypothetical protein
MVRLLFVLLAVVVLANAAYIESPSDFNTTMGYSPVRCVPLWYFDFSEFSVTWEHNAATT